VSEMREMFGTGFVGDDQPDEPARTGDISEQFFTRREVVRARKTRGTDESQHTFSIRCRVVSSNRFIRFCNARRLTYREGFDLVAELLEKLERDGQ
jgi:hypothetical protein